MKILMIIAPVQFRDEELLEPKKIFEAEEHEVTIASTQMTAKGKLGAEVKTDILLKDVIANDYDTIIVVGGRGILGLIDLPEMKKVLQQGHLSNKLMASICIAGMVLAHHGILKGKKATVHKVDEAIAALEKGGAIYVEEDVVIDQKLVTANGPKASKKFAKAIIEQL